MFFCLYDENSEVCPATVFWGTKVRKYDFFFWPVIWGLRMMNGEMAMPYIENHRNTFFSTQSLTVTHSCWSISVMILDSAISLPQIFKLQRMYRIELMRRKSVHQDAIQSSFFKSRSRGYIFIIQWTKYNLS